MGEVLTWAATIGLTNNAFAEGPSVNAGSAGVCSFIAGNGVVGAGLSVLLESGSATVVSAPDVTILATASSGCEVPAIYWQWSLVLRKNENVNDNSEQPAAYECLSTLDVESTSDLFVRQRRKNGKNGYR